MRRISERVGSKTDTEEAYERGVVYLGDYDVSFSNFKSLFFLEQIYGMFARECWICNYHPKNREVVTYYGLIFWHLEKWSDFSAKHMS